MGEHPPAEAADYSDAARTGSHAIQHAHQKGIIHRDIKPSLEAAGILRTLGEWHVFRGDFPKAAQRFTQLLHAGREDNSWVTTDDLLRIGPTLLEAGDRRGYEDFRRIAIARFAGNTDPVFAERMLKISLLVPADAGTMEALAKIHEVAAQSFARDPRNAGSIPELAAWRCVSLALMSYRSERFTEALDWCQKSLAFPDGNRARIATVRILAAMARQGLGQTEEASADVAKARPVVEAEFVGRLKAGDPENGLWYDWLFARVLLREADGRGIPHPPAGK